MHIPQHTSDRAVVKTIFWTLPWDSLVPNILKIGLSGRIFEESWKRTLHSEEEKEGGFFFIIIFCLLCRYQSILDYESSVSKQKHPKVRGSGWDKVEQSMSWEKLVFTDHRKLACISLKKKNWIIIIIKKGRIWKILFPGQFSDREGDGDKTMIQEGRQLVVICLLL